MLRGVVQRALSAASPRSAVGPSPAVAAAVAAAGAVRSVASYGRVCDEDRRWWMIHLDCAPDVNPGTFVSWLDSCGTHTTKKLVERNVWTIEQVAHCWVPVATNSCSPQAFWR